MLKHPSNDLLVAVRQISTVFKEGEGVKGRRATSISWYTALSKTLPLLSSKPAFEQTNAFTSLRDCVTHPTKSASGGCRGCRGVRDGEGLESAQKSSHELIDVAESTRPPIVRASLPTGSQGHSRENSSCIAALLGLPPFAAAAAAR